MKEIPERSLNLWQICMFRLKEEVKKKKLKNKIYVFIKADLCSQNKPTVVSSTLGLCVMCLWGLQKM